MVGMFHRHEILLSYNISWKTFITSFIIKLNEKKFQPVECQLCMIKIYDFVILHSRGIPLYSLIFPAQSEFGWKGILVNTGQAFVTACLVSYSSLLCNQFQFIENFLSSISAAASTLDLNPETRRLFIGQENGTISVWFLLYDVYTVSLSLVSW